MGGLQTLLEVKKNDQQLDLPFGKTSVVLAQGLILSVLVGFVEQYKKSEQEQAVHHISIAECSAGQVAVELLEG